MDKMKVMVAVVALLSLLTAASVISTDSDASSNSSGIVVTEDVTVSYVGYTDNGYGLLKVTFNGNPNSNDYTIAVDDGKISAPIRVDNDYLIKCEELLSEGDHTIHIKCGNKSWNLTLEVSVPTESLTLDKDSVTLLKGQSIKLSADVLPLDATYRTVFWKSSDSSVAKISQDGTVVAVSNGIATISAQAGGQTANCRIAVITSVDSVSLYYLRLSLVVGESAKLSATVSPADASDKSVYWRSSDETVATVNQDGTVTTIAPGTVTITAEAGGQQASCAITVSKPSSEHEHSWGTGEVTKAPTCTETGVRTYTCSCGEVMEETIPATGHTWDSSSVTLEPTCTEPGTRAYTCTVCGETRTESIPATGHSWSEWKVEKEATYQEEGLQTRTCSKCGTTETQIIPKLTHDVHIWGDGVITTEPTCTEPGIRTYTCICGETKTETIPATGHDWKDTSSEGYAERTCSICGTTERTHDNDDGSKTTTTTDSDGSVTKVTEGGEDGSKTVEIKTESDNSGNSVAKTEIIRTESDGSETSTKTTEVTKPDGTVVSSDTEIVAKDETTGTKTVATSKTDSSGKISCESTTTIIAESSGDGTSSETRVSNKSIDAAMKQITSMSDSIKCPEKTIHIETGSGETVTSDVVVISKESMDSISTVDNVKISISASTAKLVFDSDVVSNLKDKGELSVSVKTDVKETLTDRQKEKVGDDIVVDLSMKAGGTNVHSLGGKATVSIPFDATGRNTDNLSAWYIDGDNLVWVSNVTYSDGMAIFEVEHFSMYVIKENVSPSDTDNSDDGNNLLLFAGIALLIIIIVVSCAVVLKRRT